MKQIKELWKNKKVTFSCEVFPPKKESDMEPVTRAALEIAQLKPDFMSVTYGAGGGTSQHTLQVAQQIQTQCGVPALAHLTCVSSSREKVQGMLQEMRARNLQNVLALRGDIPEGMDLAQARDYHFASELVREIHEAGDFCVGAACYPDGHVEAPSRAVDLDYLKEKVDCGCDFLTSQMFFDNGVFYNFLYHVLDKGISVPVLAGVMPVTNGKQIARICRMSGTVLPTRFRTIVERYGDNPKAMRQAGVAYATEQIIDLMANGVRGIHLYTMNKPEIAREIMDNLSDLLEA